MFFKEVLFAAKWQLTTQDVKTTLMMTHGEIRIQEVDIGFRV